MVQEAQTNQPDEMYCSECGAVINREAEIYVHCGVRVGRASAQAGGKSKVASILLAVFLGLWTWVYTYREDGWKFWLGLGVSVVGGILIIEMHALGRGLWTLISWISVLAVLAVRIWPIVDAAVKNDDWYASY